MTHEDAVRVLFQKELVLSVSMQLLISIARVAVPKYCQRIPDMSGFFLGSDPRRDRRYRLSASKTSTGVVLQLRETRSQ